eukprot:scaffold3572_cov113-Cylindrotheca_fusiformis.AAC.1
MQFHFRSHLNNWIRNVFSAQTLSNGANGEAERRFYQSSITQKQIVLLSSKKTIAPTDHTKADCFALDKKPIVPTAPRQETSDHSRLRCKEKTLTLTPTDKMTTYSAALLVPGSNPTRPNLLSEGTRDGRPKLDRRG